MLTERSLILERREHSSDKIFSSRCIQPCKKNKITVLICVIHLYMTMENTLSRIERINL